MEWIPNGNLFQYIKVRNAELQGKLGHRLRLAYQVATGIDFLHRSHIIHRDVKSENVLLSEVYDAKLIDFGGARLITRQQSRGRLGQEYDKHDGNSLLDGSRNFQKATLRYEGRHLLLRNCAVGADCTGPALPRPPLLGSPARSLRRNPPAHPGRRTTNPPPTHRTVSPSLTPAAGTTNLPCVSMQPRSLRRFTRLPSSLVPCNS